MVKSLGILCVMACLPACLLADFSYEQTTKMTGGMMMGVMKFAGAFSKQAREPIQASVAVKGNRMVHLSKYNAQVIDLDSETITNIDFQKKTYSVMTFAEMAQAMEQAVQQMKDGSKKNDVSADFKVDLKSTGQTKQVAGFEAKEMVMTMQMDAIDEKTGKKGGMQITSDMWIAPKVAGYDEIREFHKKMATKLAWTPGASSMMAGRTDIARGMAGVYKEAAKLDGIPVLQVMKMTPTVDGQPVAAQSSGSEAQTSSQQSKPKQETPSLSGALAGRLGGFGGFGRKKKQDQPKEEPKQDADQSTSAAAPPGDASGTLMEMTTEMSGFSSAPVDPSKFSVPAGFKKVDSEMGKRQR